MLVVQKLFVCFILLSIGTHIVCQDKDLKEEKAYVAGGCFWCMEPPFAKLDGVLEVKVGYANGNGQKPSYEDYAKKGYVEAVRISYDPKKISYPALLETFWQNIDPTDPAGQFVDRGVQYRSAIFYLTEQEKRDAEKSKETLASLGLFQKPIMTEISKFKNFYEAEEYHQQYYKKTPIKYKFYKYNSGRDILINKVWKNLDSRKKTNGFVKPLLQELRKVLTPIQYEVTQKNGTEKPYRNAYWDNKEPGIYVDIVSGEPLFSSLDKYDAKTGWPSFTKPLEPANIITREDKGWFATRTEVRSKLADSHLGHVFNDGPPPLGLRYCMNSAALKFIPAKDLEAKGYGEYKVLFSR